LISMLNMCVSLLAELTTIGALFKSFVGGGALPMIVVSSLIATAYTAYGGLVVSIVTDQLQAVFSILLICCLTMYTATKFRHDLPPDLGPMRAQLGPANPYGFSGVFVMPVSLLASTVFSQSVWQRVYAAQTARALQAGGALASITVVVTVFLFGMAGFLAAWAGLITEQDDPNLYLFQLLKKHPEQEAQVDSWPAVAVLVLASTMNEGAIDSLQNGILAVLQALLPQNESIVLLRVCCVVLSGFLVLLALQDLPVLEIFLVANILCRRAE
jgi:SSS family solute:Na+ symporter